MSIPNRVAAPATNDDRRERDEGAGHIGHLRAPDAAGDDDLLRLDVAARRPHPVDPPVSHLEPEDLGVRGDLERTHLLGLLPAEGPEPERVRHADAPCVEPAEEDLLVDERDELADLGRGHEPAALDAPRLRRRHPPTELLHALLGPSDLDAAALGVEAEVAVLLGALVRERRHLLVVVDEEEEVRGVPGRAARVRQGSLVDQKQVAPAEAREVVDEAVADDPGPDDDDLRALREAHCDALLHSVSGHHVLPAARGAAVRRG
jgi:hypothetical protein